MAKYIRSRTPPKQTMYEELLEKTYGKKKSKQILRRRSGVIFTPRELKNIRGYKSGEHGRFS